MLKKTNRHKSTTIFSVFVTKTTPTTTRPNVTGQLGEITISDSSQEATNAGYLLLSCSSNQELAVAPASYITSYRSPRLSGTPRTAMSVGTATP